MNLESYYLPKPIYEDEFKKLKAKVEDLERTLALLRRAVYNTRNSHNKTEVRTMEFREDEDAS